MERIEFSNQNEIKDKDFSGKTNKAIITASVYQMAILNNMLPRGFKFEALENIKKGDLLENVNTKKQKMVSYKLAEF